MPPPTPLPQPEAIPPEALPAGLDPALFGGLTDQQIKDMQKKALRNARARQKRKEAAEAAGKEYSARGAMKQETEMERQLIESAKREGLGGVGRPPGRPPKVVMQPKAQPAAENPAPKQKEGLMTTGREEDGDPEYVYDLEKDGYDSDEWAEVRASEERKA